MIKSMIILKNLKIANIAFMSILTNLNNNQQKKSAYKIFNNTTMSVLNYLNKKISKKAMKN